jgi:trehalose-6-phosphate synthase
MRLLSVRLIVTLILGITLSSLSFSYYQVLVERRSLRMDLERRSEVLGESLAGNVEHEIDKGSTKTLQRIVERFGDREHLVGIAIYNQQNNLIVATAMLARQFAVAPAILAQALSENRSFGSFQKLGTSPRYVYVVPLRRPEPDNSVVGGLVIVHDAGFISADVHRIWRETFFSALVYVFLITVITLLIVRWSLIGPITRTTQWIRSLRMGKAPSRHNAVELQFFRPLAREVATLTESLQQARSAAETEARLRDASASLWTADRLAVHVRKRLGQGRLLVVSNREPYIHLLQGKSLEVVVPPSGLVTAIEPVLLACDGTWIAHGIGNGDADTVDQHGRLRVPPDDPRYTLRRVWLTKEQVQGYYFGFANEGLWPLCHIAHTRPIFRASDWEHYRAVNQEFAEAVLEEIDDISSPVVLIQDYHFALLPRMIKQCRPDARTAIFWHIPWPNPETFSICPWQGDLLDGLLGADLVGFQLQSYCNNFLQTVDRVLESQINWEHLSVRRLDHLTSVKPFPISIDHTKEAAADENHVPAYLERAALLKALSVDATLIGLGDRIDYTKGIPERFLAIERFLEKHPYYQGQFTFVQIGAPSRMHIKRYHNLLAEIEMEAERINWRFQYGGWKPIVLLNRQHTHQEINRYYRAADLCLVTSLHEGMNLVAKEFVAARNDERGVLVLSCFAGAAQELQDALLVNPYDIDQTAEAIRIALEMDPEDKKERMRKMRKTIREHNVYHWAACLIEQTYDLRLDALADNQAGKQRGVAPFATR